MSAADVGSVSDHGVVPVEMDPAAAFLAQQQSDIAVIEKDDGDDGLGAPDRSVGQPPPAAASLAPVQYDAGFAEASGATVNGDMFELESNGPSPSYTAIAQVDSLRAEPESLRKWREEQKARLEQLDALCKGIGCQFGQRATSDLPITTIHTVSTTTIHTVSTTTIHSIHYYDTQYP
uniref:Clathrin light chain n=1 Tax=Hucho hucho TaxID=62062 RepID=A0A4W5LV49_9TELE